MFYGLLIRRLKVRILHGPPTNQGLAEKRIGNRLLPAVQRALSSPHLGLN